MNLAIGLFIYLIIGFFVSVDMAIWFEEKKNHDAKKYYTVFILIWPITIGLILYYGLNQVIQNIALRLKKPKKKDTVSTR